MWLEDIGNKDAQLIYDALKRQCVDLNLLSRRMLRLKNNFATHAIR